MLWGSTGVKYGSRVEGSGYVGPLLRVGSQRIKGLRSKLSPKLSKDLKVIVSFVFGV